MLGLMGNKNAVHSRVLHNAKGKYNESKPILKIDVFSCACNPIALMFPSTTQTLSAVILF